MKKVTTFCLRYNVFDPFPVTEYLLCCFAAFMAEEGLAPQSIKSYLSAVRNTQLSLGLPDPRKQSALPVLKRVQMGISRARLGRQQTSTGQVLRQVKADLVQSGDPERTVIWEVCCVAFFGFSVWGSYFSPRRMLSTPAFIWLGGTWPWTMLAIPGWCGVTSNSPRRTSWAEELMWCCAKQGWTCAQKQQCWVTLPPGGTSRAHFSSPQQRPHFRNPNLSASSVQSWEELASQQRTMQAIAF